MGIEATTIANRPALKRMACFLSSQPYAVRIFFGCFVSSTDYETLRHSQYHGSRECASCSPPSDDEEHRVKAMVPHQRAHRFDFHMYAHSYARTNHVGTC